MANGDGESYPLGRLILAYVRTLMWPMVVALVVFVYRDDVRQLVMEREVEVLGLRLGARVQQIESHASAEIGELRLMVADLARTCGNDEASATHLSEDIAAKLRSLETNLSHEIAQVQPEQQSQREAPAVETSRARRAAAAERRGFEALIDRDVATAVVAFDEARSIWPEYHNVTEIGRALRSQQEALSAHDAASWPNLYREILARYSWGMPDDLRSAIRSRADAAR